jgi:DeoR/GlpR family transcriptional regulator of sugar metabolism
MFGNKRNKRQRLDEIVSIVQLQAHTQEELARRLGVSPSTITDDLTQLEERGALLTEDHHGRMSFFGWRRK